MTDPKHPLLSDWQAFCQALADAGEEVFAANVPDNEQVQAEGVRYLSRMARAAVFQLAKAVTRITSSR